jgi:uncharacterized membrane protein
MLVGVTLFAGVIINYLRREQAAGTWLESHFTWQIRTFGGRSPGACSA